VRKIPLILWVLGSLVIFASAASAHESRTTLVSVATSGVQANGRSDWSSISANGRWIAFHSWATNLVAHDTNGVADVFVRNLHTGKTMLASVSSSGEQGNSDSTTPDISANGRWVSFESSATNLVPNDRDGFEDDIFVHNMRTGETRLVSRSSSGEQANAISFYSQLSADGHRIGFISLADNLVPGDNNGCYDVFVRDLVTGKIRLVTQSSSGKIGNDCSFFFSISADGHRVAFDSDATNLVPGDTNDHSDIFVHDMHTGQTSLVSVSRSGEQGDATSAFPSISPDGRAVAFQFFGDNLIPNDDNGSSDILVSHIRTGRLQVASVNGAGEEGNSDSFGFSALSNHHVAFESAASNLVADDGNPWADVFVHNLRTGSTRLVSVSSSGQPADYLSFNPSISTDGSMVTFTSLSDNLVPNAPNGDADVFVHVFGGAP
jgi:Tol biopolymer transport system component